MLTLPLSLAWNALVIGRAFSLLNGLAVALFFEWLIVIPVAFVTDRLNQVHRLHLHQQNLDFQGIRLSLPRIVLARCHRRLDIPRRLVVTIW